MSRHSSRIIRHAVGVHAVAATSSRSLRTALSLAVGLLLLVSALRAEPEAPSTPETTPATITSVAQFWNLPDAAKPHRHRVKLEVLVYFHDPYWKLLWGRNAETDTFLRTTSASDVIPPGQRIIVEGLVTPANGLLIDEEKITILPDRENAPVLSADDDIKNATRYDCRVVAFDAYVNQQTEVDANHLTLELAVADQPVFARVMLPNAAPVPQLVGSLVRVKGVYVPSRDVSGQMAQLDIWVARPEDIDRRGWLETDPRFRLPATSIEALPAVAASTLVRISGGVRAHQPGKSLTIRDDTGQLVVKTAQLLGIHAGDRVEAIGYPVANGIAWQLTQSLIRRAGPQTAPPTNAGLPRLRLAEQVRELSPAEAGRSYPVRLNGVVMWSHPAAAFYFLQDASGGVRIRRAPGDASVPPVSKHVTVAGVTASGSFAPEVAAATQVDDLGNTPLAEARAVTLEQALTGVEEAQWVTMSGYVRDVRLDGEWPYLTLVTSVGAFDAILPPGSRWDRLRSAVIRLRGVCSATANARRQLTGVQLYVGAGDDIEIEEPAPDDPFTTPVQTIASLREHRTLRASVRRVQIVGTVVAHVPGRSLRIQDGDENLQVFSPDKTPLALGDRVAVVGFPGRQFGRVVLREAWYRRVATGVEPAPRTLRPLTINADHDGHLVRVEGRLLEFSHLAGSARLAVRSGDVGFEALLDASPTSIVENEWKPDSRVALTGVYELLFDERLQPQGVALRLRTPRDVVVLARPPWWTAGRAWILAGSLAVGGLIGLAWVAALRRQVHRQTEHIREQVEKSARLEVELLRASKLESLGVLAGGIAHDFNNLLTVIMGNITLVLDGEKLETESELCLRNGERAALRARDLTQQLLTFAKGGAPVRAAVDLPDVVREAAQFALHGSNVRCEFEFTREPWPAEADKGQVSQVLHNLVLNAKQAMPAGGVVTISLHNEELPPDRVAGLAAGRYLRLTVTDRGSGISREHLERVFDPYFTTKRHGSGLGLATVYSILKRHQGHIEVESTLGVGTTFRAWLPAADGRPPARPNAPRRSTRKTGRVLFMDDEEFVRQVAFTLLKRIGCEPTVVCDGTMAVDEFAAAHGAGRPYHLVILDLTVPGGMGGAEAIAAMKRIDPAVRAIVSSGYSNDPVMANYREHGFKAVVPKPYETEDLTRAVQTLLGDVDETAGT